MTGKTIHDGARAVKLVKHNEPFTGLAREAEIDVSTELAECGPPALLERNAIRLQVCADLYWNAVAQAADERDTERLTGLLKVWGWLTGAAVRAWGEVIKESRAGGRRIDAGMVLDAIHTKEKGGDNDGST